MIIVLDSNFNKLGVIKNAIKSKRYEEINGENTLDFSAILDEKINLLVNENSIFEVNNDYFDIAYLKKNANEDGSYTIDVEAEHISYRLNHEQYNIEFFTEHGQPWNILTAILSGTGFSAGNVGFSQMETYSAQKAMSRRQLLMEFVAYLRGEIVFNGWSISILPQRGNSIPALAVKDRNLKVVSKTINKREKDEHGAPLVSYECTPMYLPGDLYSLGDKIRLIQEDINVNQELRIVSISSDIYDTASMEFQLANYTNGLEKNLFRILTQQKGLEPDIFYNNVRIGPRYGFEAIRNDKKARAIMNAIDGIRLQKGDGSGTNWSDRIYFNMNGDAILRGETEDGFTRIVPEGVQVFDNLGQLHVSLGQFLPNRFGLLVRGVNQHTTIDEYGINPEFIKQFPNMVINSGFEQIHAFIEGPNLDRYPGVPRFWQTSGKCTTWSKWEGDMSLELMPGEVAEQGFVDDGVTHAGADPGWWNSMQTRVSFQQKGSDIRVWVRKVSDNTPYELVDNIINPPLIGTELTYGPAANWGDSLRSFSFQPTPGDGKVKICFQNVGNAVLNLDAIQMEPDFIGKWPSFYTPGPRSGNSRSIVESERGLSYYIDGDLIVGLKASFKSPLNLKIIRVLLEVDIAPVGSDLIIDIHRNDETIYTIQSNRPHILNGNRLGRGIQPNIVNINTEDKITVEVDQIGSVTAGSSLSVVIICEVR